MMTTLEHRRPSAFDLDIRELRSALKAQLTSVVKVLGKTIFSPSFCLLLPLTLLSQVKSTAHPAFIWSAAWTGTICLISSST